MSFSVSYGEWELTGRTRWRMRRHWWFWKRACLQIEEMTGRSTVCLYDMHEDNDTVKRWRWANVADNLNVEGRVVACKKCNGTGKVEVLVDVFDQSIPEDRPCPSCAGEPAVVKDAAYGLQLALDMAKRHEATYIEEASQLARLQTFSEAHAEAQARAQIKASAAYAITVAIQRLLTIHKAPTNGN